MRPSLLLTAIFFLAALNCVKAQKDYLNTDIDGEWKARQGYTLAFKKDVATISSISGNIPKKLLGSALYKNIQYVGENAWTADFYQWRHDLVNPDDGRWVVEKNVKLTLSSDKNSLTQGTRIFTRVNPRVTNPATAVYYIYFSVWGNLEDHVSSVVTVDRPGSTEKLNERTKALKEQFWKSVEAQTQDESVSYKEIKVYVYTDADTEHQVTKHRLSIIESRRSKGNLNKVRIISLQ